MKIINPERETSTGSTASSSDANFPLTNLFDAHPRNYWKASATNIATLRLKIAAGANALALFATNTDTVTCTITQDSAEQTLDNAAATDEGGGLVGVPCTGHGYSSGDSILLNGTTNYDGVQTVDASSTANKIVITATYNAETFAGTETVAEVQDTEDFDLRVIDDYANLIVDDPEVYRQCWMDYTYQSTAHTATVELQSITGTVVRGGTFIAGVGIDLPNPAYGLKEGRKDYSIKKELNNGAIYYRKRNIVRTFSGSIIVDRGTECKQVMDVFDQKGPEPFACLCVDDIDDKEWAVYARFDTSPSADHSYPSKSIISFSFTEVI
jgi:hypothetical protein